MGAITLRHASACVCVGHGTWLQIADWESDEELYNLNLIPFLTPSCHGRQNELIADWESDEELYNPGRLFEIYSKFLNLIQFLTPSCHGRQNVRSLPNLFWFWAQYKNFRNTRTQLLRRVSYNRL